MVTLLSKSDYDALQPVGPKKHIDIKNQLLYGLMNDGTKELYYVPPI